MLIQPGSASLNTPVLLAVQLRPTGGELQPAGQQLPLVIASPSSGALVPYRAPSSPPPSVYGGIRNHGVQQYLPVGNKRELTPRELEEIDKKSSRWFPKIGAGYSTPMTELLSSPAKGAAFWGGLLGGFPLLALRKSSHPLQELRAPANEAIAILWSIGGALFGGITSFISRRQHNENIVDLMQRLPEGATKRDMLSDPVYQADLNRVAMHHSNNANNMITSMMIASAFSNNNRR